MSEATTKESPLGKEKIGRLLFRLAVPMILAQLFTVVLTIGDKAFIGHIPDSGAIALTAVGVCQPILTLIRAFCSLATMGGSPLAAIKYGEGNVDQAERIVGNSFIFLLGIGLVISLTIQLFTKEILILLGCSSDALSFAVTYLRVYSAGILFYAISYGMNYFISAQGFTGACMVTFLIAAIVNLSLDWLFIFVLNFGIMGAGLAFVLSNICAALWVLSFLFSSRSVIRLKRRYFRLDQSTISPILSLGFSPFIMQSTESLLSYSFNYSLFKYGGDLAVGSMTIMANLQQIVYQPVQGLTQGSQPVLSYNYGAGLGGRVEKTFWMVISVSLSYTLLCWGLFQLFPQFFAGLFTDDQNLISHTSWAIRIFLACGFTNGIQDVCQRSFLALGEAKLSIIMAFFRKLVLLIPLIFIFPLFFDNKQAAVLLAEPVTDIIAAITTLTVFIHFLRTVITKMEGSPIRQ